MKAKEGKGLLAISIGIDNVTGKKSAIPFPLSRGLSLTNPFAGPSLFGTYGVCRFTSQFMNLQKEGLQALQR
jgi:hypothetical protein